jgi:hypothetical protein
MIDAPSSEVRRKSTQERACRDAKPRRSVGVAAAEHLDIVRRLSEQLTECRLAVALSHSSIMTPRGAR